MAELNEALSTNEKALRTFINNVKQVKTNQEESARLDRTINRIKSSLNELTEDVTWTTGGGYHTKLQDMKMPHIVNTIGVLNRHESNVVLTLELCPVLDRDELMQINDKSVGEWKALFAQELYRRFVVKSGDAIVKAGILDELASLFGISQEEETVQTEDENLDNIDDIL